MKQASLFLEFIAGLWPKLSLYIKEKVNGNTNGEAKRTYLHKTMLTPVYSTDQKWEGTTANITYVAADIVALDSPLPVKSRPSMGTSSGKLPKIGMKRALRESDINTIDQMKATLMLLENSAEPNQANIARQRSLIINKVTDDATYCAVGIDEKLEAAFLEGLSNGVALVEDANLNNGTAVRADYGYFPSHRFGLDTKGEITEDDIQKVITKADEDGNTIQYIALALSKYNEMRRSTFGRVLAANYQNVLYTDEKQLKTPSAKLFDEAFADNFGGIQFIKINRTVIYEKNGKKKSVKPWNADHIIFLTANTVGSLVYSTPAENNHRVKNVEYSIVDGFKLISKFSVNEPLAEWTTGQALALPVIEDVDQIYMLDCADENVKTVDDTAEKADTTDVYVTIAGKKYNKADVAKELTALGVKADAKMSDATLIKKVNGLSDEDEAKLYLNLKAVE
mgnify:CR=1 FL=1